MSHRSVVAFLKIRGSFEETLNEAIKLIGGISYLESPIILKPTISVQVTTTQAVPTSRSTSLRH